VSATGESFSARGFSCHAATTKTATAISVKNPSEADSERACGKRAHFGARILLVIAQVSDAINGHCSGARGNHGHDDPQDLARLGHACAVKRAASKRAGQREGSATRTVLELDHFKHSADTSGIARSGLGLSRQSASRSSDSMLSLRARCSRGRGKRIATRSSIVFGSSWPWFPARSAAMTINRIADLRYDKENPRTKMRALATGALTVSFAWIFTLIAVAVFVVAACN